MSKRLVHHLGFGVLFAGVVTIVIWSSWIIYAFSCKSRSGTTSCAASMAFTAQNLRPTTAGSIWFGISLSAIVTAIALPLRFPRSVQCGFVRGSEFIEPSELSALTACSARFGRGGQAAQITLAGVPIPLAVERLRFLIGGTTQSGKSATITEMLAGALSRGDRVVVARS